MIDVRESLHRRCAAALRHYLSGGGETALHCAYELGREALQHGLGILDMTTLTHRALLEVAAGSSARSLRRRLAEAETFLRECHSPFELAHRGARESNNALRRIAESREEEIRRLSHELHDRAGQMLAVAHLELDEVEAHVAPAGRTGLSAVRRHLRDVEQQMRRISHEMRPALLDDLGLVPALRFLASGVARRSGLEVQVHDQVGGRLPARVELALYRAAQEALTNVVHHASATRAVVRVERDLDGARLHVADDGVGLDPLTLASGGSPNGLGLRGIRERLAPLGGRLEIRPGPSGGTELVIAVSSRSLAHAANPAG